MPEKPRPPRPGSYSKVPVVEVDETELIEADGPPARRARPELPPRPGAPESIPTTHAERSNYELRAELRDRDERIREFEERERERRYRIEEASTPSKRRSSVIAELLRAWGMPSGTAVALAAALAAYTKPAAKPEEVQEIKTKTEQKAGEDLKKDSVDSSYETMLHIAYECRLNQLAVGLKKCGNIELDWRSDGRVVWEAYDIKQDARTGRWVEIGPWKPRLGNECPPFPEKPRR